jgi:hypothetical protein
MDTDNITITEQPVYEKKTWKNGSEKAMIAEALLNARPHESPAKIAEMSGLKTRQVHNIKKNLIAGNQQLHNTAVKSIKKLCQGRTFGEITEVKASDARAAAEVILSRTEPVKLISEGANQSITFTQVNINQSFVSSSDPIDILPVSCDDTQDVVVLPDIKQELQSDDS